MAATVEIIVAEAFFVDVFEVSPEFQFTVVTSKHRQGLFPLIMMPDTCLA